MIKILFFIPSLVGGGAEKVLCNLVNHLDQCRFAVTVATYENCDADKLLMPGIHYKSINNCRSAFGKRLFSYFYRLMTAWKRTYSLWLKGDYDIEVAYLECGATKVIAGSTNRKAVKLAWVHCDLQNRIGNIEKFVHNTKKYYQEFDQVVCVAESVRESFVRLYGEKPEAITLYNVIDEEEIQRKAKEALSVQKEKLTLVFVGRLTPQKKIERLLSAHRRLLNEGIDVDVWIIGEGEERARLETIVQQEYLVGRAKLLGFQENPYPYMAISDLLVCSSIYEGYSTFVTEGLILGKPIVTTDVSGMLELLGDSEYGMITPNDDEGFYLGLKRMLTEPGLLEYYKKKAEDRGREFQLEQMIYRNEKNFKDLLYNKQAEKRN